MTRLTILAIVLSVLPSATTAASRTQSPEQKCDDTLQMPQPVKAALKRMPDVAVSCRLKPTVIEGDFNGDGRPDYAVLVVQKASQKRGFLLTFGNGRSLIAGAGRPVEYGVATSADLNFDQWELYSKSKPVESADHQRLLKLHGDAVLVSYHEGASGLFYWDGKRIRWYQQGD